MLTLTITVEMERGCSLRPKEEEEGTRTAVEVVRGQAGSRYRMELGFVHTFLYY